MTILQKSNEGPRIKKIYRENIYAGVLLKTFTPKIELLDEKNNELGIENLKEKGITNIQASGGLICRKMLFQKTKEQTADDLLYYSPQYQINGFVPKTEVDRNFVVLNPICLEELLAYFNFKKDLTAGDIRRIYAMFLRKGSEKFYLKNSELFGYKEDQPEDFTYYEQGVEVTDPKKLKIKINKKRFEQMMGHRSFWFSGKDHPIPSETWKLKRIINSKKEPHPIEKEKIFIKPRIHTLF